MGKNIHTQLIEGMAEVNHEGEEKVFSLPEWMKEIGKGLQDADHILDTLSDHDLTLAFLHAGLKECMVQFRAHCRPAKGTSIQTINNEHAMLYKPEKQNVPGKTGKTDPITIMITLAQKGYDMNELSKDATKLAEACKAEGLKI